MREAVIVSAVRTAVGKASKGALRTTRPDDLGAAVIKEAIARAGGLDPKEIEDVILGCAMPEAEQGMNVARISSLRAGLPVESSAMTINRFCSSGLQSIAIAAQRIMAGQGEAAVAGGTESMTMVPMGGNKVSPNPWLMDNYPDAYLGMGLTAENLAKKYGITREQADTFSYESHQKAIAAIAAGKFKDEIVPVDVSYSVLEASANGSPNGSRPKTVKAKFDTDEGPRADTSVEVLGKLKAVFHARGVVTAGNSSQMSDGAAAAVVMSAEKARALGLKPLARFMAFATAGCPPEEMGIGPVFAIPKALKIAGLTLDQIDVIELNEAFATQALSVIKLSGIDPAKVNPNGGAIALGHPLGCTGAKLTASILRELGRRNARYGMVTMCVGGGMGAAGIFERLS
ncbi:MAG TPA: acetyl-CoA C-acyltransferase [Candidatus Sulfotelmatobacter sp.]|jgi:acetyl-CoA acyltransferase|nr:acetyl-CoA C-acyltransferase [Candidatus Sulfotelmatobacter sp.]